MGKLIKRLVQSFGIIVASFLVPFIILFCLFSIAAMIATLTDPPPDYTVKKEVSVTTEDGKVITVRQVTPREEMTLETAALSILVISGVVSLMLSLLATLVILLIWIIYTIISIVRFIKRSLTKARGTTKIGQEA